MQLMTTVLVVVIIGNMQNKFLKNFLKLSDVIS